MHAISGFVSTKHMNILMMKYILIHRKSRKNYEKEEEKASIPNVLSLFRPK